jgi:hypothetical protein
VLADPLTDVAARPCISNKIDELLKWMVDFVKKQIRWNSGRCKIFGWLIQTFMSEMLKSQIHLLVLPTSIVQANFADVNGDAR